MKRKFVRSATWVQDQGSAVWVANDRRSVLAMLRGKGDGRHKLYNQFAEIRSLEAPGISIEQIGEDYEQFIRAWEESRKRPSRLLAAFRTGFAKAGRPRPANVLPLVALIWAANWLARHF